MNGLIKFCVDRPVFSTMISLIVVLIGLIALFRLPVDLLPEIELPRLTIGTSYDNAAPEEIEELITRPIEQAVAVIPGVEEITSSSSEGSSSVTLSFVWGTNLDEASNDIRDRLDRILNRLPDEAERPRLRKFDPNTSPIVILGAYSPLDPLALRELLDDRIQSRLERLPGVGAVDVFGGLEREVRIEIDPQKLAALGITLDQVAQAIREANVVVPAGEVREDRYRVTLRTPGLFGSLDEILETVVAVRDGAPIDLHQIARVLDTHQEITRIVRINGEPGVRLGVRKQSGANTVDVAERVLAEVERINSEFPQLTLVSVIDSSEYIRRAIANVGRTILVGGFLAIAVLLFFLGNIRSTAVVAASIPISVVATFGLMYFGGFTLNLMTLGGLALGIGMMVDNAIVVLENIFRLREQGLSRREAAIRGASEVSAAITASTLTTMAIFLPLVFLEGVPGLLFRQLAQVIAFSLLCSLGVALTLVPMLASHLPEKQTVMMALTNRLRNFSQVLFGRLLGGYSRVLDRSLLHPLLCLGLVLLLLAGAFLLLPRLGTEFMPAADEREVRVNLNMPPGTRIELLDQAMQRAEEIVADLVPEAVNTVVDLGASGWRPSDTTSGNIRISLPPYAPGVRSSEEVANVLRGALTDFAGVRIRVREGGGLFVFRRLGVGGGGGGEEGDRMVVEVRGFDLPTLDALASAVERAARGVEGITDTQRSRETPAYRREIQVDRSSAADLGLTVGQVARALQTALGGQRVGEFRDGSGREIPLRLRLQEAEYLNMDEILDLTLLNSDGERVALRSLITLADSPGVSQIDRRDQQRITTISMNIMGRGLSAVAADLQDAFSGIPLPTNYEVVLRGDYEEQQEAFRELLLSLVLSILLVYMVLACLYESLRDPFIVLFSVPLAGIGAIGLLWLTGSTLNVQSYIGLIMLGGIVVNNAILIVDQANRLYQQSGITRLEAARTAGRQRLRPVLMTSLTTILALLPLAMGMGEGAEAQAPLARTVIGGLISSTVVTLLVIPSIYGFIPRPRSKNTSHSPAETELNPPPANAGPPH